MTVLRDAWILIGFAFAQLFLTVLFAGPVPCAFLTVRADTDENIRVNLEDMTEFMKEQAESESPLTPQQVMSEKGKVIGELVRAVPWMAIAVLASILIYPFLGWWSSRLLHTPQLGGLLIVGSVLAQHNIMMVPRNIEYWNLGNVSLSLPKLFFLVLLQFFLFTIGMLAQRGNRLLEEE